MCTALLATQSSCFRVKLEGLWDDMVLRGCLNFLSSWWHENLLAAPLWLVVEHKGVDVAGWSTSPGHPTENHVSRTMTQVKNQMEVHSQVSGKPCSVNNSGPAKLLQEKPDHKFSRNFSNGSQQREQGQDEQRTFFPQKDKDPLTDQSPLPSPCYCHKNTERPWPQKPSLSGRRRTVKNCERINIYWKGIN